LGGHYGSPEQNKEYTMNKNIKNLVKDAKGASAVEYALIIALIAAVIGVGVAAFGGSLNTFFSGLFASLNL
jgi:Flp pilus assembly pilin Flp